MERHLHAPLTWPKHGDLLEEINNMKIAIVAWYAEEGSLNPDGIKGLRERHKKPSWAEIQDLFQKCYNAIDEQREDPRKY